MRNPVKYFTQGHLTPLKTRFTFRRIRMSPDPWSTFFLLFSPWPLRFPLPCPIPSVEELQENGEDVIDERQLGMRLLMNLPLFRARDTPLRSLYRLCEDICAKQLIMMGYECEYFFFHKELRWSLERLPDPQDEDPIRYAVLASMAEALVDAFNWRLELGLRRNKVRDESEQRRTNFIKEVAPPWTSKVGPLEKPLNLVSPENERTGITAEPNFLRRNIRAENGYLYTV
ncbi:MAG: hypothetical protein M1825_005775 [Sarcosagium campestre]|nr:MAG: hypothetical protein M1825_005775 [Sarcosagium campestre]